MTPSGVLQTFRLLESRLFEPTAAVSHPPRDVPDGKGRAQGPPDRQDKIGSEPEHGEGDPEDLALHGWIVRLFHHLPFPSGRLRGDFGLALLRNAAIPALRLWV